MAIQYCIRKWENAIAKDNEVEYKRFWSYESGFKDLEVLEVEYDNFIFYDIQNLKPRRMDLTTIGHQLLATFLWSCRSFLVSFVSSSINVICRRSILGFLQPKLRCQSRCEIDVQPLAMYFLSFKKTTNA